MPLDDRIAVSGSAVREVAPDEAIWQFEVHERAEDARSCFEACASRQAALLTAVRQTPEVATVFTGPIRLHVDYDFDQRERRRSYVARSEVRVSSRPADSGTVLAAASAAQVDDVRGPTLCTTGLAEIERELLERSVLDARSRAEVIAAATGRTLGRVISVEEGRMRRHGDEEGDGFVAEAVAASAARSQFEISSRPLEVAAHVRVTFELA